MKVLVVKLTSMGDTLHLLPALSDLQQHSPEVQIDWMIEQSFAEIPAWHPSVDRVILVATRKWRKFRASSLSEFLQFWRTLRARKYDVVIDAQGLIKSAIFARFAKLERGGQRIGLSAASIKEKPAARFYATHIDVPRNQHAIERLRQLFAQAFNYSYDDNSCNYSINTEPAQSHSDTIVLLHGTTWPSKHLPEAYWHELVKHAAADNYQVVLPWGNDAELQRAQRIAAKYDSAHVLPKSSLHELRTILSQAAGAIAVDTGLGHMAAALGVPTVSVYGSTNAKLTGAVGRNQHHIQASYPCSPCLLKHCDKLTEQVTVEPCYARIKSADIWALLHEQLA